MGLGLARGSRGLSIAGAELERGDDGEMWIGEEVRERDGEREGAASLTLALRSSSLVATWRFAASFISPLIVDAVVVRTMPFCDIYVEPISGYITAICMCKGMNSVTEVVH